MTIKRSLIFVLDICHLFLDTGYLSKNYFEIFEKKKKNSGIRDIRGRLLWDIGYLPKQASEVRDLLLGVNSRRQMAEIIELPSYVNNKSSWCHMISLVLTRLFTCLFAVC